MKYEIVLYRKKEEEEVEKERKKKRERGEKRNRERMETMSAPSFVAQRLAMVEERALRM